MTVVPVNPHFSTPKSEFAKRTVRSVSYSVAHWYADIMFDVFWVPNLHYSGGVLTLMLQTYIVEKRVRVRQMWLQTGSDRSKGT